MILPSPITKVINYFSSHKYRHITATSVATSNHNDSYNAVLNILQGFFDILTVSYHSILPSIAVEIDFSLIHFADILLYTVVP